MFNWHKTQNDEYLKLCSLRLGSGEPLHWVMHFVNIINNFLYNDKSISGLTINDIGCNVGHFLRGVDKIKVNTVYNGYDISSVYLDIAKQHFKKDCFYLLDASEEVPKECDVTVISATMEHVLNDKTFLKNILNSSKKMVIIRTFLGDSILEEKCCKDGAEYPYVIKQFTKEYIESLIDKNIWKIKYLEDIATNGRAKKVCDKEDIIRTQKVIILEKI